LLERRAPPALAGVEPHERTVGGLLQGIEPEQPHRRLDRALGARSLGLMGQQSRQGLQGHLSQPLALGDEPLLEQRLVDAEPQKEVAPIQLGGLFQRLRSALGDAPFEGGHVDFDRRGIHGQGLPFDAHGRRCGAVESPAQVEHGMAQSIARLAVALVAPEQSRQLVAGVTLAGAHGEVRQQGLRLLRRKTRARARSQPGVEATKERHFQATHPGPLSGRTL
jgi:hypothetical protein